MKHIGVLTSGGDAPGMNAAIRAVTRKALYHGFKVTGISRGYAGLIEGDFRDLTTSSVSEIIQRGGTMLRTARSQDFFYEEGRAKAVLEMKRAGIDGLVVIGGDGTFRGAAYLNALGVQTVAIPATIDNDIPCTDVTVGFDTAVNTAVEAINKIRDTATSHERAFIIEVMGKHNGQIALMAGIAGGAESILIPEVKFNLDTVAEKINLGHLRGKIHSVIVVAEGVGSALEIGNELKRRTEQEVRVIILGHLQRGGSPTAYDRLLASRMGAKAVEFLSEGTKGQMVGLQGQSLVACDLNLVLSQKKNIDLDEYALAEVLAI